MLVTRTPAARVDRVERARRGRATRWRYAMWIAPGRGRSPPRSGSRCVRPRRAARSRRRSSPCGSPRPPLAWWLSRPLARRAAQLTPEQTLFLRALARRTWRFFETFVGADDNWLPPDNFQEHPVGVVAHRTSPTNIGLSLLANLAAYDFGYLTAGELIERTAQHARHDGTAGALPRPLLQLVRHADAAAAAAALRLDRRQRQPRRPPADAAAGPARAGRRRHPRRRAASPACATPAMLLGNAGASRQPSLRRPRCRDAARRRAQAGAPCILERWQRRAPTTCSRRCRRRRRAVRRQALAARSRADAARCLPPTGAGRRCAQLADLDERRPARRARERHAARSSAWRAEAGELARDGLRLPVRHAAPPARDRLQRRRAPARRRASTTCSPPRRAWPASSRSPRASCRRSTGSRSAGC